jgi:hypothetical protein
MPSEDEDQVEEPDADETDATLFPSTRKVKTVPLITG